jgi:four helix bundle protein
MGNQSSDFRSQMSERFLEFASKIMKLEEILYKTYSGKHIYGQLFRSGSSTGANYEESIAGQSRADFIHKTQVALKEARESNYWLRLIRKSKLINEADADLNFLLQESFEFIKILSSSVLTAKQNKTN